jgi:HD superfamily phosphohydrolase
MTEIKNHDAVKVKSTGKISRIIDISYAFNRYQIEGVSGWQYGIKDLEKQTTDSLITTIESQANDLKIFQEENEWLKKETNGAIQLLERSQSNVESQKEEIEKLKNPSNVVYVIKAKRLAEYVKRKHAEKCYTKNIREAIRFSVKSDAETECFKDEMVVPYVLQEGDK